MTQLQLPPKQQERHMQSSWRRKEVDVRPLVNLISIPTNDGIWSQYQPTTAFEMKFSHKLIQGDLMHDI